MNVIYVGPFDTNGVYKGGIAVVVQSMYEVYKEKYKGDIKLCPFNSCQINRRHDTQGRLNIQNLRNTWEIAKNLFGEVKKQDAKGVYYNSSRGYPLLKDLLILKWIKKKTGIKTIVHIHFADYDKIFVSNKMANRLIMSLLKQMDGVVFLSKKTEREFEEKGLDKTKTTTIYNFHSYNITEEEINNKIKRYHDSNEINLIFLGSISKRKGILDLLDVLNKVESNYVLHICGIVTEKSIEQEYSEKIGKLKQGRIIEHGYVSGDEKKQLLLESDILVLPSYSEGFPLVLLEAAALGCAIITTKVGAVTEVFSDDNGRIVDAGDTRALLEEIEYLSHNDLSNIFINNFRMSHLYSVEEFMKNTIGFIDDVMECS